MNGKALQIFSHNIYGQQKSVRGRRSTPTMGRLSERARERDRRGQGDPTQVDTAQSAIILAKANNSSRFLAWLKLSYAPTHTLANRTHTHTHTETAKGQRMLETFAVECKLFQHFDSYFNKFK